MEQFFPRFSTTLCPNGAPHLDCVTGFILLARMAPDWKPAEAKKRPISLGWGEVRGQMFWSGKKTIEEVANRNFL